MQDTSNCTCFIYKVGIIDITCSSYTDFLIVKAILQQIVSEKAFKRAGRKFTETESKSEKTEVATTSVGGDVKNRKRFNTEEL
jgi:hypothetical protein